MLRNINFRSLAGISVLCFASAGLQMVPATPNFTYSRIIDSSGSKISSIYHGLKPDDRFATQLHLIAKRKTLVEESSPAYRTLTFQEGKSSKCNLIAAAFRGPRALAPRPGSCNGQYMEPQWYDCLGCEPGNFYEQFSSTGTAPCNGYYYPHLIGDCQGCEIAERYCASC